MPQAEALFCYWLPVILSLGFNSAVRGAEPLEGFLEKHCVRCHGAQAQKGDLRFDRLSRDFKTAVDSHHWAEALDKVNSGEMPPKKEPQPTQEERAAFVRNLDARVKEGRAKRMAARPLPEPRELELARDAFRRILSDGKLADSDKARVARLIAQLGSDKFREREQAAADLKNESVAALPLLREAAKSVDAEVAVRAARVATALQIRADDRVLLFRQSLTTRRAAQDASVVGDIIALLDDSDSILSEAAWLYLSRLTEQDFGYRTGTDQNLRRQAAGKARDWWDRNKADFVLKAPEYLVLDLGGGVNLELVQLPSGKFMMGSAAPEKEQPEDNERPQHEVTISDPFYMSVHEVTQEQYERIVGANPSTFKGKTRPVENVSWADAVEFCKKLSSKTGKSVSLPTEAQWEYGCRANSNSRFSFGDKNEMLIRYGWYGNGLGAGDDKGNSENRTHPVGQLRPNDFGLYDMHGNVWEWCADWYADSYEVAGKPNPTGPNLGRWRVLRGGSWGCSPADCRSALRNHNLPGYRNNFVGFRIVVDSI